MSQTRAELVFDAPESVHERAQVAAGRLPARYAEPWFDLFSSHVHDALRPEMTILDVGSGRLPAISPSERPHNCTYVGLDISAEELGLAAAGDYDETICRDVTVREPALEGRFDLIVSWQVFEHLKPLPDAIALMRGYLRPGGRMIAQLSGGLAAFSVAGRLIPHSLTRWLMTRLLSVPPDETFPTHYDHCRQSALERAFRDWSSCEIVPRYKGARYFRFFRPLEVTYLGYENWIARHQIGELATHYLVDAVC